ncbi:MAG: ROK family protein [Gemmatimonadota bacterium]|nr:ROK family protein [Gemmatimonadota bacterium]MDH4347743.1 ROK family protein [Gemmatimonadota bacterium]MDH5282701.1 ROK family protein [Gemmatimonadota bacterium]
MHHIVGVDLGGTNIVTGVVAEDGSRIHGVRSVPTGAEQGPDAVVERIVSTAKASIADARAAMPRMELIGAGIGSPGPLDRRSGLVLLTPNLGWVNMPLRQRLQDGLGLRTALDNDANCAILGEWWQGAARGTRVTVGLTIGTGIGGGIIIDGRLFHGATDIAGEIGHMTIDAHGRRCKCGNYGCIEAYASGPNIALRAVEAIQSGGQSTLPSLVRGELSQVTAQTVYDAAHAGDELALEVVRDTAKYLGAAVASLINIFNPEAIVIVGGVTRAGESLFEPLRREVARRAFKPAVQVCRIVPGELTGEAGVYGAARAFIEQTEAGIV